MRIRGLDNIQHKCAQNHFTDLHHTSNERGIDVFQENIIVYTNVRAVVCFKLLRVLYQHTEPFVGYEFVRERLVTCKYLCNNCLQSGAFHCMVARMPPSHFWRDPELPM